jgi:large subunit ribosomal protein L4
MKVTVYNLKREAVGELDLSDEVFGAEVKEHLFYEVVKAQLASRRSGTKAKPSRR